MTTRHYRSPITCGCREPGNVARQLLVNSASGNTSPNRSRTVTGNGGSRRRYAARPAATTSGAGSGHDRGCTDIGIHHPTAGDGEEPTAARSSSPTPVRRIKTRRRQQPGPDRAFDRCLRPWPVERTVVEPVHHVIAVDGRQRSQRPRVGPRAGRSGPRLPASSWAPTTSGSSCDCRSGTSPPWPPSCHHWVGSGPPAVPGDPARRAAAQLLLPVWRRARSWALTSVIRKRLRPPAVISAGMSTPCCTQRETVRG